MQNHQDIQEKIFLECKSMLESLSEINSSDELLQKQNLLYEVAERVGFLKNLDKNKELLFTEKSVQNIENQEIRTNIEEIGTHSEISEIQENKTEEPIEENLQDEPKVEFVEREEEPIFTFANDLEEPVSKIEPENFEKEAISEQEVNPSFYDIVSEEETNVSGQTEEIKTEEEPKPQEIDESRRKIVEIQKENAETHHEEDYFKDEKPSKQETHHEKKFRLANIKGLKSVQSLFDDDPLEKIEEEKPEEKSQPKIETPSLLKSNVSTDFMEAEKTKPEFRLDLNDKIAFSQKLFGGSQSELNNAVNQLNKCTTLEEAKEYLSDLYYEHNWKKADEYAQRLWSLVENKFL